MIRSQARAVEIAAPPEARLALAPRLRALFQLTKPRLNLMVLTTTFVGFFVATGGRMPGALLFHLLFGTALVAGGAATLNMYVERERDGRMARTARRPLPLGQVSPLEALIFGIALGTLGTLWLSLKVGGLTALLGVTTLVLYVWAYTPLKPRSSLNTPVGAVAGALPPVMGWAAARGTLGAEAAILFGILFLWQHPHFLSLAWIYRKDYARGGYRMLPQIDATGTKSAALMVGLSAALIPVSLALTALGLTGWGFGIGATALGLWLSWLSVDFLRARTTAKARRVFRGTLIYLPALLALMMWDLG